MLDIGYSPVWARREEEGQWNVKWSWLGDFSGSYWPVPVSFLSAPVLSGPHSNSLTVYCSALEPWRKLQDQSERSLWIQKGEMHACMKPEYLKKIKLWQSIYNTKGVIFTIFFFLAEACRIWVPWPGIEPAPPARRAWGLNHWTTREVPLHYF